MTERLETHPYNTLHPIPANTETLIVGTAPPPRFSEPRLRSPLQKKLDFDFFYGSGENYMWEILRDIAKSRFNKTILLNSQSAEECTKEARQFLQTHNIWMRDVLQTYRRMPRKSASASDGDIIPPPDATFSDFRNVFVNEMITKIAFTSEDAAKWTIAAILNQNLISSDHEFVAGVTNWKEGKGQLPADYRLEKYKSPFHHTKIYGREVAFYILPTPSPHGIKNMNIARKTELYEQALF